MALSPCPCGTKRPYEACCGRFHQGALPQTAEELMRSRYAAYVLNKPKYIIKTTHPSCPEWMPNEKEWVEKILAFSRSSRFQGLEILRFEEKGRVASVTFIVHLSQKKQDATFTETSNFEKVGAQWLYRGGHLVEGKAPNLATTQQLRLLPLAYYGEPVLRMRCEPVADITGDLKALIAEMIETMDACDGLGLAAPQVHHAIRLFVIRKPLEAEDGKVSLGEVKVFINPEVSPVKGKTWSVSEGCLSIPRVYADVERPVDVDVEYTTPEGARVKERCSGWEARVIQHENDHIDGVLFIDHLPQEERSKLEAELEALRLRFSGTTVL